MGLFRNGNDLRQLDGRSAKPRKGEILAFSAMRDERLRVPYFLDYHKALGVNRFYIVDNGSTDGTTDYLLNREDCHVFYTEASFAASRCGVEWLNRLISKFGTGHWGLVLDADELLVYPHCEDYGLRELTHYLDGRGVPAMQTFMLDMYANQAIRDIQYEAGQPFLDSCPYFDPDGYTFSGRLGVPKHGGPRVRAFWHGQTGERTEDSPYLPKVPLVKWRRGFALETSHVVKGLKKRHFIHLSGVLLHYKFFQDFAIKVEREAARGEYWNAGTEYQQYRKVMKDNPTLNLHHDMAVKYQNSMQLVDAGLMQMSEPGWPV